MSLTCTEYESLLQRSKRGEIVFFYDAAQCKKFLLRLNWKTFQSDTGKSLRAQCSTIRAIVYVIEPLSLLVSMIASFMWLKWWGLLIAPVLFFLCVFLKSVSSGGRQSIAKPTIVFAAGIAVSICLRNQGVGFVIFMLSLSTLYLAEKMLYALPVLFFSFLTRSCYDLVSLLYERSIDEFNKQIGCPIMWHVEKVDGALPKPSVKMPSRAYLALYGIFNRECRISASSTMAQKPPRG